MEELLNKLIKKWWKPFWWDDKLSSLHKEYGVWKWYIRFHNWMDSELFDLRQLTSKESWIWQFVCENGMRPKRVWYEEHYWQRDNHTNWRWMVMESEPEYRIIESALKDEDDLEKFLLDNIKVDD